MKGELLIPFATVTLSSVREDLAPGTTIHAYCGETGGVIFCHSGRVVARLAETEESTLPGIRSILNQHHRVTGKVLEASSRSRIGSAYLSLWISTYQAKRTSSNDLDSSDPLAANFLRSLGR